MHTIRSLIKENQTYPYVQAHVLNGTLSQKEFNKYLFIWSWSTPRYQIIAEIDRSPYKNTHGIGRLSTEAYAKQQAYSLMYGEYALQQRFNRVCEIIAHYRAS